jgi:acetylornithine deacetylase/succinyl-diaminopimelate desuccinylase-like protein
MLHERGIVMRLAIALAAIAAALPGGVAAQLPPAEYDQAAREVRQILAELVAAATTNPPGEEARAVAFAAARLQAEGIPYDVHAFAPGRENLVARLRGDGSGPPILLLAHTDVVGTAGQPWTSAPHVLSDKDGFLVARGVSEALGMAAVQLEVMLLLQRERVQLRSDVVLVWTGDGEAAGEGMRALIERRPELVRSGGIALAEGGGPVLAGGGVRFVAVAAAEKTVQDFAVRVRGTPGSASRPEGTNAIARLARAISRMEARPFPPQLQPVTRAYFRARAPLEEPDLAAAMRTLGQAPGLPPADALAVIDRDPALASLLRTTCVPTVISGGTHPSALPADAAATVSCRILPGDSVDEIALALSQAVGDPEVELGPATAAGPGGFSPVEGPIRNALTKAVRRVYGGTVAIVPAMTPSSIECRTMRARGVACYGVHPFALSEADAARLHGADERVPAASLRTGVEFLYGLVYELAAQR